jgi:hypothetical protein
MSEKDNEKEPGEDKIEAGDEQDIDEQCCCSFMDPCGCYLDPCCNRWSAICKLKGGALMETTFSSKARGCCSREKDRLVENLDECDRRAKDVKRRHFCYRAAARKSGQRSKQCMLAWIDSLVIFHFHNHRRPARAGVFLPATGLNPSRRLAARWARNGNRRTGFKIAWVEQMTDAAEHLYFFRVLPGRDNCLDAMRDLRIIGHGTFLCQLDGASWFGNARF